MEEATASVRQNFAAARLNQNLAAVGDAALELATEEATVSVSEARACS